MELDSSLDHPFVLRLSNYRCFADHSPASITIADGLTAITGINNSGKSSLLRFFYEFRPHLATLGQASSSPNLCNILGRPDGIGSPHGLKDPEDIFNNNSSGPIVISIVADVPDNNQNDPSAPFAHRLDLTYMRDGRTSATLWANGKPIAVDRPQLRGSTVIAQHSQASQADLRYIISALGRISHTVYLPSFRNAVNAGGGGKHFDMDIGQAFILAWRTLKTGASKRQNAVADAITEDIRGILGFDKLEIDASEDNSTLKLNIDRKAYRLDEVGSGIAQFVLALVTTALARPHFVLIDEPELNLHPTMQLDFLACLYRYAKHGVIYATHSLGLARNAANTIYTLHRKRDHRGGFTHVYPYNESPVLAELIGSLSYASYKQLGFDCVLLVEGPTDVLVHQEFLRKWNIEHKVLTINLGGASGINGEAAKQIGEIRHRMCPHVFAIVDSERTSAGDEAAKNVKDFEIICNQLGVPVCVSRWRAIENYYPAEKLGRAIPNAIALQPYEKLNTRVHKFCKKDGWRVAHLMTKSDLALTELGPFFDQIAAVVSEEQSRPIQ